MKFKALFVIEAIHKSKEIKRLLSLMNLNRAEVIATGGHLCGNPPRLRPCCVDRSFQETHYSIKPDKHATAELIKSLAMDSEHVFLATDDDAEGDVIARDVFALLDSEVQGRVFRCRLKAVTLDELKREIDNATRFEPALAHKGDARRILDRLIGALSDHDGGIGRVQSSFLLALKDSKPVTQIITHVAREPSGRLWQAKELVRAGDTPWVQHDVTLPNSVPDDLVSVHSGLIANHAFNYNELVLTTSLLTLNDIDKVASALQQEYEEGNMTYPRATSHRVSQDGLARALFVGQKHGVQVSGELVSQEVLRVAASGHEAPNCMNIEIPLNRDIDLLSVGSALQAVATQRIIDCMTPATLYQLVKGEHLQQLGFPDRIAHLDWFCANTPSAGNWHDHDFANGSRERLTQAQSLLLFSMEHNLGRPSTIVPHITRFLTRGLVEPDFSFTPKGEQWLHKAEQVFCEVLSFNAAMDSNKLPAQIIDDFLDGLDLDYLRQHKPAQIVQTMLSELALIDKIDNILSYDETGIMNEYEIN